MPPAQRRYKTAVVYRLLNMLAGKWLDALSEKLPKCTVCKARLHKEGTPRLFLIPVFHDGEYTPSTAYYRANCTPIADIREIPTGRRACRFWTLACPECRQYKILVEDFLQVRDAEVIEKRSLYDYADFQEFLL